MRLRPIMMTTAAAVLGAVPLAIGIGQGASLRQPLGVTVMGGLILSQVFTLYTTPVIYLYLDRLRARAREVVRAPAVESPPRSTGYERIMKTISRTPLATAALALLAWLCWPAAWSAPTITVPLVPTPATYKELPGWTAGGARRRWPEGRLVDRVQRPAAQ